LSSPKLFRKDEVQGKIVIEASGKALGKAKDMAFGLDGTVALIVLTDQNSEVQITLDRITGVDEYIVVKGAKPPTTLAMTAPMPAVATPISAPPPAAPVMVAANHCRNCGALLKTGAKFCTKCGTPA
jgi:sporulation protein YlmC with PRC-barrel domain